MSTVVWGIDVSTTRVAFAATDGATCSIEIPRKFQGAERLAVAREMVRVFTTGFAETHPPLCVWVEQPTGRHPKPTLIHMVGVVQEAVFAALMVRYKYPVTVYPIAVASWKKAALGHGNARKDAVRAWAAGLAIEGQGHIPLNQDEADALAIAFAGRSMISEDVAA